MASRNNVQNTRTKDIRAVYLAVAELVALMNRPQRDARMIEEAGIPLDRALFPLLVGIGRFGPIGIVELADRAGRDHTTVSRQVARLEELGFVRRQLGKDDKRVREAAITAAGRKLTDAIDKARDRLLGQVFADWRNEDVSTLATLLGRLAKSAKDEPPPGRPPLRR